MANEKFYVTQEGYNDLVNEHENLVHKVRQEVIVELQEARAQGDLSENADYDAAREHQAQVEGRIRELEAMIKNAEIISEVDNAEDKKKKITGTKNPNRPSVRKKIHEKKLAEERKTAARRKAERNFRRSRDI